MKINNYLDKCRELQEIGADFISVTITQIKGSAPQELGAKMLVSSNGLEWGTIGGGKVEAHCIEHAKSMLKDQNTQNIQEHLWNLQKDIKMTCGGEVRFLFEKMKNSSSWQIAVFGAGHVSQALCYALSLLDCEVLVFDTRKEWLDKIIDHPRIKTHELAVLKEGLNLLNPNCFVVSMTMGHAHDVPILCDALKRHQFPYLGVIGSASKRNAIVKDLKDLGVSEKLCEHFHCPIGEKFGRNEPAEIAMSIIAQLLIHRDRVFTKI